MKKFIHKILCKIGIHSFYTHTDAETNLSMKCCRYCDEKVLEITLENFITIKGGEK